MIQYSHMENINFNNAPKFKNPEEELVFLRARLAEKERILVEQGKEASKESLAHSVIKEYKKYEPKEVMHKSAFLKDKEINNLVLRLKPEAHDHRMEELLGVLLDKGVSNVLSVISKMNNPHLDDDFHRFLIQYLCTTHQVPGLKEGTPLFESLNMTLFEITLPNPDNEDNKKGLKELLNSMEQFYAGMHSIGEGKDNQERRHFTLEIAMPENTDSIIFYASVPNDKAVLFENQLIAVQADAKIISVPDDYNIFFENGESSASYAKLTDYEVYPIKLYDFFDHDPMNIIINVFNKLKKTGEGAAIQFVICPLDNYIIRKYGEVLRKVKNGEKVKVALSEYEQVKKEIFTFAKDLFSSGNKDKEEEKKIEEKAVSNIEEKLKSTIMATNIRIVASSSSKERSKQILGEIESSFNQFTEAGRNGFKFERPEGVNLTHFIHDFVYRDFSQDYFLPLNLKELSTIFHFPYGISAPQLKESKSGDAPAPMEMGGEGIILGVNSYRGRDTEIRMSREDRMRHMYVIGQTGTGKTTLLKNMIAQDIANGDGCCFIDPHGTDINQILSYVPKERIDDVIYFDPSYTARPMGLNMLEYDPLYPEQKTFVVNELMSIFNKLFDMKTTGGPMFDQYFKNSAFLAMDDPNNNATLLEITRILSNEEYRHSLLEKCRNPIVVEFWKNAEQTTGDQSISNFVPYITSKFDNFISNDIMRPVVLQEKSVFNFREIMDNKKILIVNLSKGKLGEINANLIGLLLVGKIQMAAMSRVDMHGKPMNDFYLYIDEFQNVTTDSIASILSEARKYRLSLTVAHQYISQLEEGIKNAVFGNVGSIAVYRVSTEDANFVEHQFKPTFTSSDIVRLDNFNSYVKMLVNGQPTKPFSMRSHWSLAPTGNPDMVEKLKELSYLKFGRPREEIEEEIMSKYRKMS